MTNEVAQSHVKALIEKNDWDGVFVVTTEDVVGSLEYEGEVGFLLIDSKKATETIMDDIYTKLKGNLSGFQVAVNLFSGTGKEHMAILGAILKLGMGVRLVKQGKEEVEEL